MDVSSEDHNDLPIVSITTDPDGLFNEKTGIYCLGDVYKEYDEENPDHPWNGSIPANYNQRGREWEKNVIWSISTARATVLFLRIAA